MATGESDGHEVMKHHLTAPIVTETCLLVTSIYSDQVWKVRPLPWESGQHLRIHLDRLPVIL
ncbi:hypothetical protein LEMLEM_LOCUS23221, partial [Lemmus lemmus]